MEVDHFLPTTGMGIRVGLAGLSARLEILLTPWVWGASSFIHEVIHACQKNLHA